MTDSEKIKAIQEIIDQGGDAYWRIHEILKVLRDGTTHEHDFVKDLDGQVTCATCGAMDDKKELSNGTQ